MTLHLVIAVRSHDGRYHGAGDGPPAPFRLFQALIAGAGLRGPIDTEAANVFRWLEARDAPVVASPRFVDGQSVAMFVPNNDLDAVGGDPRKIAQIRTATKNVRPRLFDSQIPWLYCWRLAPEDERHAVAACTLAEQLYQLGRGTDMAWAWGELIERAELDNRLADYDGEVFRPSHGSMGPTLECPAPGSFESLERRHYATRFRYEQNGKSTRRIFVKPPRPSFRHVTYESAPVRFLFELRRGGARPFWRLTAASTLVVLARDAALERIASAMPERRTELERCFVGRGAGGSTAVPIEARMRIIPIPSIGARFADRGIRRLLVEVPSGCAVRAADVRWAFSGAQLIDPVTGEVTILAPCEDTSMLRHYAVDEAARVFRSVTPVVLPGRVKGRGDDAQSAAQQGEGAKHGSARRQKLLVAASAVTDALRHAGLRTRLEAVRLQREPFDAAGQRAEPFAKNTRFEQARLWHIEIVLEQPVKGPLVLGDGRFLGLGILAPVLRAADGLHEFAVVDGLRDSSAVPAVTRATRRAVMARVQAVLGSGRELETFFTGHAAGGAPARGDRDAHIGFAFEPTARRLLIIAPHVLDRRPATRFDVERLRVLDKALEGFGELLAGAAGRLRLYRTHSDSNKHALLGHSRSWTSVTPYVVTRHARGDNAVEAIAADVRAECRRAGLPTPIIEVQRAWGEPGRGLMGNMRLRFPVGVSGPLVLGRERFAGGGLFRRCVERGEI